MKTIYSEKQVHDYIYRIGLESLITNDFPYSATQGAMTAAQVDAPFELWQIMRARALDRLARMHNLMRQATLSGSQVNLPTGKTRMQLDLLGYHDEGLFVLELKVNKTAERNAFSELFAYSNYVAEIFAPSGRRDITNVLVANIDNEITRHAFLYDLLIADREVIVYRPVWDGTLDTLRFEPYIPNDQDFRRFTNQLLSHDAMSCVVASFDDLPGWYDSQEDEGSLNDRTIEYLSLVSTYAAQLMEAEGLHGFCFMRKPYAEVGSYYDRPTSLIICAINPFGSGDIGDASSILAQIPTKHRAAFIETPHWGFNGRLIRIAQRAVAETLQYGVQSYGHTALWSWMITSMIETVHNHKFAFRPTGMLREAYGSYLGSQYAARMAGHSIEDRSLLQGEELYNWFQAWDFMERCGFKEIERDYSPF